MGVNEYNKVSPEVQEIIKKAEQRHPANLQLQHLQEIQSILELAFKTIRNNESKEERSAERFQTVAEEIREYVKRIEAKEAPETPDTSKPLLEGLKALEKALTASIKGINVKPEVNVAAPNVTVDAPRVETKGIEKAVKELGKEFDKAVKSIPKVELPKNKDYTEFYKDMLEKLEDIGIGVRLKPQAPESVKVTNSDGSEIGSSSSKATQAYSISAISEDATYKYFWFEDASLNYYIMRKHKTNKVFTYTTGTGGYSAVYVSSSAEPYGSPTWSTYGRTF